ncbi:MAG: hypothetical protein NTV38_14480 [Chloroflexi bacterium]|nr:hypothetical protein [Chloroflexota bacterium]
MRAKPYRVSGLVQPGGRRAYAQMRQALTIRTGELARSLRLPSQQVQEVIARLARRSLIAKVRRGLYLVPLRLPLGGTWSPDPILALTTLMEDRAVVYMRSR